MNNMKEENLRILKLTLQNKKEQRLILEEKISKLTLQLGNLDKNIDRLENQIQNFGKKKPKEESKKENPTSSFKESESFVDPNYYS